jgi:MFS family permease
MIHRPVTPAPLRRRLAPLVLASFAGGIALWVPVEKLFLDQIGFTPTTLGIMAAAYAGVVPLLEVPSGILADRWSRRGVLIIGNIGAALSVLIGGLSTNVTTYLVAAILLGVYFAMQSGTVESIVYDTVLEETGTSDAFEVILGRIRMVTSAALVLGALAGGALAAVTAPRLTYFATLPFLAVSTAALLAFREPVLHQAGHASTLRQHISDTVGTLRGQPHLVPVAGLLVVTALLTQAVYEFGPLWLVEEDTSAALYGPAWAALMASLGLGGALAGRVRLQTRGPLAAVVALLALASATLLVSHHPLVITGAQVVLATFAVAVGVLATRLLHDSIPSAVRSSVSSGIGAATWATFLPFALAFGAISDRLGVHTAGWLLVAAVVLTIGLFLTVTRRDMPQPVTAPDARIEADTLTDAPEMSRPRAAA